MNFHIKHDEVGNITMVRPAREDRDREGYTLVQNLPDDFDGTRYYWNGFEVVPYSPEGVMRRRISPGEGFRWSPVDEQWVDERPEEVQIEALWKLVRSERDRLLAETDWRVTKAVETGVPLSAEWQAYRQALRDITTVEDPRAIVWPTLPA